MRKKYFWAIVMLLIASLPIMAQQPAIIPMPTQMTLQDGTFTLKKNATISCANAQLRPAANYLRTLLGKATGYSFKQKGQNGTINLALTTQGKPDSYSLTIDKKGISIVGNGYRGVIYAIATLRQLFPEDIELNEVQPRKQWQLPYVSIKDEPRFSWRGMELDCSRHFFTKSEVESLLDALSLYKINKMHWHLTDDQGWRIEIKRYPKLTSSGAWRTFNNQDSICMNRAIKDDNPDMEIQASKIVKNADGTQKYGGFYTQEDIREIVEYAKERGIDIIPEIDMPGHSMAAIKNYDGLSCFPEAKWGQTFSAPMCPGKESMLEFCKNVWAEVFNLFPSEYVHIGGDEVEMSNWYKCPDCQKRMKQYGLKTGEELQAWFLHYMEDYFNQNGKRMIGWDEIIAGGLSATSTVMWWRSWSPDGPKRTTSHGNNLICTPNAQFYLDYDEDINSIPKIYNFDPFKGLDSQESQRVLGVQGNLWTEWVPSVNRMWHMAFPRMLAIAELGWTSPERMNLQDFQQRLIAQLPRLRKMNVRYRTPDLTGFFKKNVFIDKAEVKVECADTSAIIRYTTDGSIPQVNSKLYEGPFTITTPTSFTFRTFASDGHKGNIYKFDYVKEDYAKSVNVKSNRQGLEATWYDYAGANCEGIDKAKKKGSYTISDVSIPKECKGNIGLVIKGYINVPADGIYTFYLNSDDGSYLKIDDTMVVDNDGEHSPVELVGQYAMSKGWHHIYLRYFDHNGGILEMRVKDANGNDIHGEFCH